jgi:uncharacterized glyoxalase superfamily protein PhnB
MNRESDTIVADANTSPSTTTAATTPRPMVWPTLSYRDAPRAIDFLVDAFGFVKSGVYLDEDDPANVMHAELRWPPGGGVMLGSAPRPEGWTDPQGHGSTYCVTESDRDVDAVYERALAAGATSVREPRDEDYGGRTCVVADFENNHWSFGSYRGE